MKVRVKMFALARDLVGAQELEVTLSDGGDVAALRRELVRRYPQLVPLAKHLLFAVDSQYASDAATLSESSDVACIPPVSGG